MKLIYPLRNVQEEIVIEFSSRDMDAGVVSLTIRRGRDLSGEEYEAVFYADEFKAFLKVLEGVSKFSE